MNTTIRKEFVDTFNKLTHKLSPWEVWKDVVGLYSNGFRGKSRSRFSWDYLY